MLNKVPSSRFKKDLRRLGKSKMDLKIVERIITRLTNGEKLERKYRDHPLSNNLAQFRECHVRPNLLLVYKVSGDDLYLYRLYTHDDLKKECLMPSADSCDEIVLYDADGSKIILDREALEMTPCISTNTEDLMKELFET